MILNTVDRYLGKTFLLSLLLASLLLLSILILLTLVEQLDDTGRGSYGTWKAIQYVLLTAPQLLYELLPLAAIIASMSTLGILANNNELVVIRSSGLSKFKLGLSLMKTGLLLAVIGILIGELVAPSTGKMAKEMRSMALANQVILRTASGFWSRDKNNYIYIKKIFSDKQINDIYIYEFGEHAQLKKSLHARSGSYIEDYWLLKEVSQINFNDQLISSTWHPSLTWVTPLKAELINSLAVRPQYLSTWELLDHIQYLKSNKQNSASYEQALWSKWVNLLSIFIMLLLSVLLVKPSARTVSVSQRVFAGILIGALYHLANQVSINIGIIYNLMPLISVALPSLLLLPVLIYHFRCAH